MFDWLSCSLCPPNQILGCVEQEHIAMFCSICCDVIDWDCPRESQDQPTTCCDEEEWCKWNTTQRKREQALFLWVNWLSQQWWCSSICGFRKIWPLNKGQTTKWFNWSVCNTNQKAWHLWWRVNTLMLRLQLSYGMKIARVSLCTDQVSLPVQATRSICGQSASPEDSSDWLETITSWMVSFHHCPSWERSVRASLCIINVWLHSVTRMIKHGLDKGQSSS